MAYTIPIPESALHTLLLQQLPRFVEGPEIGFVSGRVIVEGRLRKLGMAFRFVLEFEPIASAPDDSDNALDWRIRNVRPFLVRWALRSEVRQRSARASVRVSWMRSRSDCSISPQARSRRHQAARASPR